MVSVIECVGTLQGMAWLRNVHVCSSLKANVHVVTLNVALPHRRPSKETKVQPIMQSRQFSSMLSENYLQI
jgi:hypothetical protein